MLQKALTCYCDNMQCVYSDSECEKWKEITSNYNYVKSKSRTRLNLSITGKVLPEHLPRERKKWWNTRNVWEVSNQIKLEYHR